jgi:hypothetical protein
METISQRGERRRREPDADVRRQNRINHLRVLGRNGHVLKHEALNINKNNLVAPRGYVTVCNPVDPWGRPPAGSLEECEPSAGSKPQRIMIEFGRPNFKGLCRRVDRGPLCLPCLRSDARLCADMSPWSWAHRRPRPGSPVAVSAGKLGFRTSSRSDLSSRCNRTVVVREPPGCATLWP